jgi:hypothetical protein
MALEGEGVAVCGVGGGSTEIVVGSRSGEPAWVRSVGDPGSAKPAGPVARPADRRAEVFLADAALAEGRPRRRRNGACAAQAVDAVLGASDLEAAIAMLRESRSARVAKEYGFDRGRARTLVAGP